MIEAEHHNSFFFAHKKIKNLKELLEALEDPQYSDTAKSHVTEQKNDYANWIKDVLKEEELSEKISKEKDIPAIAKIIKEQIEFSEKNPETAKAGEDNFNAPKAHDIGEFGKELHLNKETSHHKDLLKKSGESRHFCPRFFECMKKEFLFGFALGIILGIVIAIYIKIGAI